MYTSEDVEMLVQDKHTALSTCAWNEEYLHVHMQDDYDVLSILLSKEQAELLRDTLALTFCQEEVLKGKK